ncbi:hypothetical protein EDB19DRAFT_1835142 [Suillus lakei]|nr:hypothetical protein EDB19DRAFT_1835142 [Suillus lakei]
MSKCVADANKPEPSMKHVKLPTDLQPTSLLADPHVWDILETFLTSSVSIGLVIAVIENYLSDQWIPADWKELMDTMCSAIEDDEEALQYFRQSSCRDINSQTSTSGEAKDQEEEDKDQLRVDEPTVQEEDEAPPPLMDPHAWEILERFLTVDSMTYEQTEKDFHAYLGDCHLLNDWKEAQLALFSGDADDALSLLNFCNLKLKHLLSTPPALLPTGIPGTSSCGGHSHPNIFIDAEAGEDDGEDEEDEEDIELASQHGPYNRPVKVMYLPEWRYRMSDVIERIKGNMQAGHTPVLISLRTYFLIVPRTITEFLAGVLQNNGISVTISPWVPGQLYIVPDSPHTVLSTIPESHKPCVRRFDHLPEEQEEALNRLCAQLPNPTWVRVNRGEYKDAIAYIFDSEQMNDFVTVLIPPRDFPYPMAKGSITLFDPSRLPAGKLLSDIIHGGAVIGYSFKGEEYYSGLLKKKFHRYCLELVPIPHPNDICLHIQSGWDTPFIKKAEIAFSNHRKEMEANLDDVERIFHIGDEVKVIAGAYMGLEGHIIQKYDDIFHVCQSGTQEEVQVSKYYLDCCPVDHMLHGHQSTHQYIDPPLETESIQISDYVQVLTGDSVGKSGTVEWVTSTGSMLWFRDTDTMLSSDDLTGLALPAIQVPTSMVEHTCLPPTIKFSRDRGYDIKPGDVVSVSHGPGYCTTGVVHSVDFPNAQLTLETDNAELVKVPIGFIMKMCNADLNSFNQFISKEVFIIGGSKKGFQAMLYNISSHTCQIALHAMACI